MTKTEQNRTKQNRTEQTKRNKYEKKISKQN